MGSLYVVGLPRGGSDELTFRARRVLASARQWIAADPVHAQARLTALEIDEPAAGLAAWQNALPALAAGDVALVVDGARPGVDDQARQLVALALEHGFPVIPVPGPALPLTALVLSGLPADSFCYAGELPAAVDARHDLIEAVAAERRTLLFLVQGERLVSALQDFCISLGDRPLVIVSGAGQGSPWRGTLAAACEEPTALPEGDVQVLVIGGAAQEPAVWDEVRLVAAIERRVAQGHGAREISQALTDVSGWSRREIYRRATERTGTRRG